jgi:hypothetical protein
MIALTGTNLTIKSSCQFFRLHLPLPPPSTFCSLIHKNSKRSCQLDITCSSPLVLAVPNGDWAVTAAYKLLEQSPTLLLRQLPQKAEYTHFSRFTYAYCTPVTATVSSRQILFFRTIIALSSTVLKQRIVYMVCRALGRDYKKI